MKNEDELPEAARNAFELYPHVEPSAAFNRGVLESLASAQSHRRQSLVGQLEEFLGVGLWQFMGSGALGAFLPALVLSGLLISGHSPQPLVPDPAIPNSTPWSGFSPFSEAYRREDGNV